MKFLSWKLDLGLRGIELPCCGIALCWGRNELRIKGLPQYDFGWQRVLVVFIVLINGGWGDMQAAAERGGWVEGNK